MKAFHALCVVLLVFGSVSGAKFDDFEDEDDIVEYDDNDFAEFEDVVEDSVTDSPQRVVTTEDDEDETTVELEGQDENQEGDFEDADTQVRSLLIDALGDPKDGRICDWHFPKMSKVRRRSGETSLEPSLLLSGWSKSSRPLVA